jgi:hypothetical protein
MSPKVYILKKFNMMNIESDADIFKTLTWHFLAQQVLKITED